MGFSIVTFGGTQKRARDGVRKADLRTLQTALRLYYNDHGAYPDNDASTFEILGCGASIPCGSTCAWGTAWTCAGKTYMSKLSKDPKNVNYRYDLVGATGEDYTIDACLEDANDPSGITAPSGYCTTTNKVYEVKP